MSTCYKDLSRPAHFFLLGHQILVSTPVTKICFFNCELSSQYFSEVICLYEDSSFSFEIGKVTKLNLLTECNQCSKAKCHL